MTRQEFLMVLSNTKYIDRTALATHDAEQRQRIEELEEWKRIVLGTGTDQEAVIRMAATEYTKVAVQCWKEKCEQQAQEIARLREALQLLYDVQNGCPLPTYQADWDEAMVMTERLLKEHP